VPNPRRIVRGLVAGLLLGGGLALAPVAAAATEPAPPTPAPTPGPAWTVDGLGSATAWVAPEVALARAVAVEAVPGGGGATWVATADGGVFPSAGAPFFGSLEGVALRAPIVDLEATPDGRGYWLLGADGGVFTFGDAAFHGSTGAMTLNSPVLSLMSTPSGDGYWLVAGDGGIFTFGDAAFLGSTGGLRLNAPVVDAAATRTGQGYWLAAADGAVFTFGDAPFLGSAASAPLAAPVAAMAPTRAGDGYWLLGRDGGVFTFGRAAFPGAATVPAGHEAVDLAPLTGGSGMAVLTSAPARTSVGPPLPAGSGTGRRIVYSNAAQRVWLVGADGIVEQSHAVSGRRGVPAPGTYAVWSTSTVAWAGHGGITMRLMVRFAHSASGGNIGFHTIPTYADGRPLQSDDELGEFRSSGCVRQSEADARYLWDWADLGTTVVVVP
jgi:hypothetical protein